MPPSAGGGGGGAGGGPAFGIGGKAIAQAIGKRGLSRALPRLGAHVAGKTGAKLGAQFGAKAAAKIGAGAVGKSLAKKIPGLGLLAGLGFGAQRLFQGDILGAAGEVASGAASTVPGLGTAASIGIDAALAARDMGATPFAKGGIISSPTLSMMGEGNKKEGVFPLQGREGKKTFEMFGQGMIDAQKKNSRDFAAIQAKGLRQYYENEDGFKKMGEIFGKVFEGLKDILGNLLGGAANAATGNPADYLGGAAGGQDMMTLATIAALESGSAQGQADVAQSVYNRLADKTYGSSITDILTKQGQYQVAFKDPTASRGAGTQVADEFKNIKTEDDAVKAMMYYYNKRGQNITAEQARQKLRGSVAAIQNADLQKKAAAHVGGRTEFRGYDTGRSEQVHRGGGSDNYFVSQYGSGTQMARGAAAAPTALFDGSTSAVLSTGRLPALPDTGTMHGQAYGANRRGGRKHAGVDFDIKGNEKFYSRIGGTVVKVGYDPSGYGNYVDIYNEQLKVTERIAEGAKVLVQQGQKVSPGAAIVQGETNTGVIHYEIRKGQGGYGFSGTLNPLNFLASATSKNPDVATARPAAGGGGRGSGGRRGSGSSPGSLQASAANQNNGTAMMATSAQVQMGAMGLTTPGGNVINNIYNTGGQQSSPMGNTLSAGTPSGNAGLSWLALVRR
jgi:murein DD-endopeptidase MepM/ murein hydrolase activator NlpD